MRPVDFKGTNCDLEYPKPGDYTYHMLRAMRFENNLGVEHIVTAWMPNKEDIEAFLAGRPVFIMQTAVAESSIGYNKLHVYTLDEKGDHNT